jgi:hypothetical protein
MRDRILIFCSLLVTYANRLCLAAHILLQVFDNPALPPG